MMIVVMSSLFVMEGGTQDLSDSWLVSYKMGTSPSPQQMKTSKEKIEMECIFPAINLWAIRTKKEYKKSGIVNFLEADRKNIRFVHADIKAEWRRIPNDPDYALQWGMKKIGMEQVWDVTTGGQAPNGDDIVIAIFDDGFQVDHRDYAENVWINELEIPDNGLDDDANGYVDDYIGWNVTADNDDHNVLNHGTSVAGIIGAKGENSSLIAGMNWTGKMMLTSGGTQAGVDLRDIVSAYNYVFGQRQLYNLTNGQRGALVVALSYSGGASGLFPDDFPAWCEVIDALGSVGVLTVGSAPNENVDIDVTGDLPGTCPSSFLITVTNTDRFDKKASPAGFGRISVDLGAPGDGIFTTAIGDDIDPDFFGTSAATPFVAGIIPLMYSIVCEEEFQEAFTDPSAMALRMKSAIINNVESSVDLEGITTTGGRLNAFAAINEIDQSIGNCCEVTIDSVMIVDETCIGAEDGQLIVSASGFDLNGPLQYSLLAVETNTNELGIFNRLEALSYNLSVVDPVDGFCKKDTILEIQEGTMDCPFDEFVITDVIRRGNILEIAYSIDEQKNVQIQIHDSVGRLMYDSIVVPELAGVRTHQVETSTFPDGVYHASILATGFRDVASFIIVK